jgi:polyhydroxyalkanoate synthesis regulator phasin
MNDGPHPDASAPGPASTTGDGPEDRDDALPAQLAALRKALAQSVVDTGERVQETIEDAVRRGRMTRKDAQELAATIIGASRRQTDEIRQELEALLDRGRRRTRKAPEPDAEPVTIPIERRPGAERTLPIERYDELTAVLIRKSLAGLSAPELRAVREHEAAHAKRKTVLAEVDRLLDA